MKNFYTVLIAFVLPLTGFTQTHLLLSEVTLTPSAGEFIEIYNPTPAVILLENYYLADHSSYATLPASMLSPDNGDFIVRFPVGATIVAGQTMTIAMGGTDFTGTYAVAPDFEIISQDAGVPDMIQIQVTGTPSITNAGEGIILFYWDGQSDLVQDVDMVNVGIPTAANLLTAKTGIMVDGPDADAIPSTYLTDALTIPVQSAAAGMGFSTKRILYETGHEITSGGNGVNGHDETSENTAITWDQTFTAPNPGISSITTGITEYVTSEGIQIYPNPASDMVWIRTSGNNEGDGFISDVTGRVLLRFTHKGNTAGEISLKDFANGVYLVTIFSNHSQQSEKLIITR